MTNKYEHLITKNQVFPLESIPFHKDVQGIERFVATNFPFHLAIHLIKDIKNVPRKYVELHTHSVPEINVLIGNQVELKYQIQLGNEIYVVESPASIWIPAGLKHAATVIEGSGFYVCLILTDTKRAFVK